jgi:DNA adenine methylase
MTTKIKPFLKWVGGKTQIIDKLMLEFPKEINNYYEPFLGGGSVLLALLIAIKNCKIKLNGQIFVSDVNEPLIYVYKNIQNNYEELFIILKEIIDDYNNSGNSEIINRKPLNIEEAKLNKENYYYWIRSLYNKLSIEEKKSIYASALFIFLNKTCFRGLFRTGSNGFNVPYGNYKNPEIINKNHLEEIHNLIKDVIFNSYDFELALINVQDNDFIYFDPPYAPETTTSFVGYTDKGFLLNKHMKLFEMINYLNKRKIKFILSNADVTLVKDNFKDYEIISIECKRSINAKKPNAKTNELLIKNF